MPVCSTNRPRGFAAPPGHHMQRSFTVVDNAGREYTVVEQSSRIRTDSLDGPSSIEGLKSYRLASGGPLNRNDDGTFRNPANDMVLRLK